VIVQSSGLTHYYVIVKRFVKKLVKDTRKGQAELRVIDRICVQALCKFMCVSK
jgi:hypothetical protein